MSVTRDHKVGGLNATGIHCLTVPETRTWRSRRRQNMAEITGPFSGEAGPRVSLRKALWGRC